MRSTGRGKRAQLALAATVMALVALVGVGSAGAEKSVTAEAGNLKFTFNGGFAPKKLPKKKLAPITLSASGMIQTKDGTHPPALKEAIVETDKNGAVFVKGLPVCKSGQLQSRSTKDARKACPKSIIGTGKTTVEVQFPESKPVLVKSDLTVFNGGQKGGKTTFYIHAFFTAPISGAIVTTLKIQKVHNGRYGLKTVASVPKIANGSGSVLSFNLKIGKKYTYKGKKVSVLSAKCTDGKLQAKATSKFSDGTQVGPATIIRACTPQG